MPQQDARAPLASGKRRPTPLDIAAETNRAVATVSRPWPRPERVTAETASLVWEVAERLEYRTVRRNPLRGTATNLIAAVLLGKARQTGATASSAVFYQLILSPLRTRLLARRKASMADLRTTRCARSAAVARRSLDLPFAFVNVDRSTHAGSALPRHKTSRAMAQAWSTVARSGDPNHPGIPQRRPLGRGAATVMHIKTPWHAESASLPVAVG